MSGRKIDDHSFFAGGKSKGSVFPEGVHHKMESSAEGSGHITDYPDTTEAIHKVQEASKGKVHSKPMKPGYRY
jgi:hypothetical protein